jgi:protein-S-isoprenylcysteine O-methyltransferase Ste14
MDKKVFLGLVIICIITHVIRSIYEILKHKKNIRSNKLTFMLVFINMALLWISWFLLCYTYIYKIELTSFIKYSGLALLVLGVVLFLSGLFTIKTLESYEGDLITKGIYSTIRHPMYLGFILWLIGAPIFYGSLFLLILSFLFIANILFWRYLEEKELAERFPTYLDYKRKTIF